MDDRQQFLTTAELAARWHVGERTLRDLRANGDGCPFVRLSSRVVRYPLAEVKAYEAENFVGQRAAAMSA